MYNLSMNDKKKRKIQKPPLPLSDEPFLTENKINSFLNSPEIKEISTIINNKKYGVNDLDITYRIIGNWDSNNLLPSSLREGNGWRKFTFVELVWIYIIKHLREFGLSLEKIEYTKDCIMIFDEKSKTYNSFEYYVIKSWKSNEDPYLMVAQDGYAEIGTFSGMRKMNNLIGFHDRILISLAMIVEEIGNKTEEKLELLELDEKYKELVYQIKSKNKQEIKIKTKNGDISEIESSYNENPVILSEIRKQIKQDGSFGSISIPFENGKYQNIKVTKGKRFK